MKSIYGFTAQKEYDEGYVFKISNFVTLYNALDEAMKEGRFLEFTVASSTEEAREKFAAGETESLELAYEFLRRVKPSGKYDRNLILNPKSKKTKCHWCGTTCNNVDAPAKNSPEWKKIAKEHQTWCPWVRERGNILDDEEAYTDNPSRTYGDLPSYEEFCDAWDAAGVGKRYAIANSNSNHLADGQYTRKQLYAVLKDLTHLWLVEGDEEAGDDASAILQTLGIEWV